MEFLKTMMIGFGLIVAMAFGQGAEAQTMKQTFQKQVHFAVSGCAAGNGGDSYAAPKCFGGNEEPVLILGVEYT